MYSSTKSKDEFLRRTAEERQSRAAQKVSSSAAVKIQRFFRNATGRKQVLRKLRVDIDATLAAAQKSSLPATELFHTGRKLLYLYQVEKDNERFVNFCQAVVASMEVDDVKVWYVTLALNKKHAVAWIKQVKELLKMASQRMKSLKPGFPKDDLTINCLLSLMVTFCDYTLWKFTAKAGDAIKPTLHQLCLTFVDHLMEHDFYPTMNGLLIQGLCCLEPKLTKHSLPAAMGIRALALRQFSTNLMLLFIRYVLSVPASMLHLEHRAPEMMKQLHKVDFLSRITDVLLAMKSSISSLDSNSLLSIMSNFLYLGSLEVEAVLLEVIPGHDSRQVQTQSSSSFWHPLLGWCNGKMDSRFLESFVHVRRQLQCLWHKTFVQVLFSPVLAVTPASTHEKGKSRLSFGKRTSSVPISQSCIEQANQVCEMYLQLLSTVVQISSDLLVGLCCNEVLLSKLWSFLKESSALQMKPFINMQSPLRSILVLFCQVMQYMLGVFDDQELFEEQKYFSTADLIEMSSFLNHLLFHIIWENQALPVPDQFQSLLMMLYHRDSQRHFCSEGHWLIRELKMNSFMSELKANKARSVCVLAKLPHIIPHRKRVEIFHRRIDEEKERLGITSDPSGHPPATYITIHRARILEDGYIQLSLLTATALKGTIRVKFINVQGLDEAGIDEMGVFKEYLEETIAKAFDPALNLFKSNTAGHLFPSASSHIHENHLSLFEFVGKMLGKAVYEGIVVDVPFAAFFLSQMLQHQNSMFYSYFDELASMDPEMYKSLNFIKHFDGDMSDLCLTFSWDEEFMGKTVTHELVPGGCGIPVTIHNRINYVHRMALFRMCTQIKEQTSAFMRGFHSIISTSLLQCFSPQELQKLISGDQVEIDVDDLRKHTEYYGGYHEHHRVVSWLWDIVKNDFNAEEKGKFLKFVTSCSRPPLLGFEHLHPPFSIRYVQASDEEDSGDTVASVVKGFFSLSHRKSRHRLPTASTCFNLLKLPDYTKKSVLREKLRYAIHANTGFELS